MIVMKYKNYILIIVAVLGLVLFVFYKFPIQFGICSEVAQFQNGNLYCAANPLSGHYMWPLLDFSLAILVVGILNLVKPAANRVLLILTAISAVVTAIAVMSAPEISRNILSPFDKKFVGQLCAGAYLFVGIVLWLRAYLKNKHGDVQQYKT